MEAILLEFLDLIFKDVFAPFAITLTEDAITGKLSAPTVVHDSVATPEADKVVGDALVDGFLPK